MRFNARSYYVKRDDLFDPLIGGNKFRKLYWLWQLPDVLHKQIISYGGVQSNAMVALAKLCALKRFTFDYYVKAVAKQASLQEHNNLFEARVLGMQLHEVPHAEYAQTVASLQQMQEEDVILIPQGGATDLAKQGIEILASEIVLQTRTISDKPWRVVLPSGTGTTAHYLAHYLHHHGIAVYTSAIVGDECYLKQQIKQLDASTNVKLFGHDEKWPFAKPKASYLRTYHELIKQTGIEFDLIYAPRMWELMQRDSFVDDAIETLYLHTGGVSGNTSMLQRYGRKKLH